MKTSTMFVLFAGTLSANVLANDAGIVRCRGIADTQARLACYDALPLTESKPATPPAQGQPAARATPAASAMAAAPAGATQLPTRLEQFGLENRTNPDTLNAIDSHIPGRFEGWEAKSSIRLANGQVWQIADDSSRYVSLTDPKVRIRRGALGSFYLEFEKINHSPRVRRVQ